MEKKIGSIDLTSFVKIRRKLNEKQLQTIQGNDVEMVAICELKRRKNEKIDYKLKFHFPCLRGSLVKSRTPKKS
jgi:hypothetical protein